MAKPGQGRHQSWPGQGSSESGCCARHRTHRRCYKIIIKKAKAKEKKKERREKREKETITKHKASAEVR
jgi:hypothetical protein